MRNEGEKLYIRRKRGSLMGYRYLINRYSPALILFLVALVLSFSMVFVSSMATRIDRLIVLLGSGSITTNTKVDVSEFDGAKIELVKESNGILYSDDKRSLVHIKGVDTSEYFSGERGEALKLKLSDEEIENGIIISSSLSKNLSLDVGSSLTLLLYESDKERARPILMKVKGIYSSVYSQLDKYLVYLDSSYIADRGSYEILLDKKTDLDCVIKKLSLRGISALSYKEKYASLCANVDQSIMILNIILILVALLAAFFSSDIAHSYILSDRKSIASLRLLGMREKRVRNIYRSLTINSVFIASVLGILVGLFFSLFSPSLLSFVAAKEPEIVEYYVSSFTLNVPYLSLFLMLLVMVFSSYITLTIELYRTRERELIKEIKEFG